MLSTLKRSTKRLLVLLALLPATVLVLGTIYMFAMAHLEGAPRITVVAETGYVQ